MFQKICSGTNPGLGDQMLIIELNMMIFLCNSQRRLFDVMKIFVINFNKYIKYILENIKYKKIFCLNPF